MVDWSVPRDLKELSGFLWLTSYYQRFVRGYGKIAEPFTCLLIKNAFRWNEGAMRAFEALKEAMVIVLVILMPNFYEFIVEINASGTRLEPY